MAHSIFDSFIKFRRNVKCRKLWKDIINSHVEDEWMWWLYIDFNQCVVESEMRNLCSVCQSCRSTLSIQINSGAIIQLVNHFECVICCLSLCSFFLHLFSRLEINQISKHLRTNDWHRSLKKTGSLEILVYFCVVANRWMISFRCA